MQHKAAIEEAEKTRQTEETQVHEIAGDNFKNTPGKRSQRGNKAKTVVEAVTEVLF